MTPSFFPLILQYSSILCENISPPPIFCVFLCPSHIHLICSKWSYFLSILRYLEDSFFSWPEAYYPSWSSQRYLCPCFMVVLILQAKMPLSSLDPPLSVLSQLVNHFQEHYKEHYALRQSQAAPEIRKASPNQNNGTHTHTH